MSDNILTLKFPHRSFFATPQKGIARGATFDPVSTESLSEKAPHFNVCLDSTMLYVKQT